MKLLRRLLVLATLLLALAVIAVWWNWPHTVDMANYAPADALIYIELNSLADITRAIKRGEVFESSSSLAGINSHQSNWTLWVARAGLAPAQSVVFARSQMALVVVDIDRQTSGDSLRVKPEAALIVETKTAKWRMRAVAFENVKELARFAYGATACTERPANNDYIDCTEPGGSRKIIAAVDGSSVIIGNSDKAVESCVGVRRGQRPSLSTDSEFTRTRTSLQDEESLAFGYVSQANAARLVSLVAPLLVGKDPGDTQFENLISTSAAKIFRGIAWTSKSNSGGIEDHYQISLDPEVTKRLQPAFQLASEGDSSVWQLVPDSFRALTVYQSSDVQSAWSSLNSALAMKLDAVSTVLISSLLKSSLASYGVENPKEFLANVTAPVMTIRPAVGNESLLLGRIKDEAQLRKALANLVQQGNGQILASIQDQPNRNKEFTALFTSGYFVLGKTENLLVYLDQLRNKEMLSPMRAQALSLSEHPGAAVVTYTNERDSVGSVVAALARLSGRSLSEMQFQELNNHLSNINVSFTESRLNENGIDRRTQSAFGQFGNLLSLAVADSSSSNRR